MFSRRTVLACALALLCSAPLHAQATKIRVGSWNIEHLGFPGNRFGDADGIAQTPQDLADHIKDAGIDVLALQEIGDTDNPGRKSKTLDTVMPLLSVDGQDWTYELTPNKNMADKTQLTGVAWNRSKVEKVGLTFRIPVKAVPGSSLNHWDRHPSAFKFSAGDGKTDFVVISLHMKAGGGSKNQRKEEAETLKDQLAIFTDSFKEEDIIIIGDTNVRNTDEDALSVITGAGFKDLNADGKTTVPWGNMPFDHIFVKNGQNEFNASTMTRIVHNNGSDRKKLSDHFLIYTDVAVQNDDDQNPPFGGPVQENENDTPNLSILAAIPNPIGSDEKFESVTLANATAAEVSLAGWKLVDASNNTFNLSGTVPVAGTRSVRVRGSFSLNQDGDTIRLLNPANQEVHKVQYTEDQVKKGKFITFGN